MINNFLTLVSSLGVSIVDLACIVYVITTCLIKPIVWFVKKFLLRGKN